MAVKQKPDPKIVKPAAKGLAKAAASAKAKPTTAQKMGARILDDQKNAPQPHKPASKKAPKKGK